MARKSALAVRVEYSLLRTACALANALPYAMVRALARGAAWTAFNVLRINRRRTLERVRAAFPGLAPSAHRRIALDSLANLFATAAEMACAPKYGREWIAAHVKDVESYAAQLKALADEGRGVVVMVPHSGNWYMAAWAMASFGVPIFAIAARQRNPLVNAWMRRQYGDRLEVVERGSAGVLRAILARLRRGKVFAILPDLRVPEPDTEVDFLNGRANVSHSAALFAVTAGCPIVVAAMRRRGAMHEFSYLATLRPDPAADDRKAEARRLTREAMALIDGEIHRSPGDWFWFNKRWILQPVRRGPSAAN